MEKEMINLKFKAGDIIYCDMDHGSVFSRKMIYVGEDDSMKVCAISKSIPPLYTTYISYYFAKSKQAHLYLADNSDKFYSQKEIETAKIISKLRYDITICGKKHYNRKFYSKDLIDKIMRFVERHVPSEEESLEESILKFVTIYNEMIHCKFYIG